MTFEKDFEDIYHVDCDILQNFLTDYSAYYNNTQYSKRLEEIPSLGGKIPPKPKSSGSNAPESQGSGSSSAEKSFVEIIDDYKSAMDHGCQAGKAARAFNVVVGYYLNFRNRD